MTSILFFHIVFLHLFVRKIHSSWKFRLFKRKHRSLQKTDLFFFYLLVHLKKIVSYKPIVIALRENGDSAS